MNHSVSKQFYRKYVIKYKIVLEISFVRNQNTVKLIDMRSISMKSIKKLIMCRKKSSYNIHFFLMIILPRPSSLYIIIRTIIIILQSFRHLSPEIPNSIYCNYKIVMRIKCYFIFEQINYTPMIIFMYFISCDLSYSNL